jgi:hypothetical protein
VRIARVLREDPEECEVLPVLALERDGALYDVGALDRLFGTPYDPDVFPGSTDFHTRLVALDGAGLDVLDARLRAGERPSEARLLPGTFTWLPPCDPDRALLVHLAPGGAPRWYRVGNARGLAGHEATVVVPDDEAQPAFGLDVAAVLQDDLRDATPKEAEAAILGYAILNGWSGRDDEARTPAAARRIASQLGPVLVTADEVGPLAGLRVQARVDGQVVASAGTEGAGEALAWLSRWIDLRGGDVIGLGCVRGGSGPAPGGATVDLLVERLGKLTGRARR